MTRKTKDRAKDKNLKEEIQICRTRNSKSVKIEYGSVKFLISIHEGYRKVSLKNTPQKTTPKVSLQPIIFFGECIYQTTLTQNFSNFYRL